MSAPDHSPRAPVCNLRCAAAMFRSPVDTFVKVLLSIRWVESVNGSLVPCSQRVADGLMATHPPEWGLDSSFWCGPWFTSAGIERLRGLMLKTGLNHENATV